jgi:hypothetical protein
MKKFFIRLLYPNGSIYKYRGRGAYRGYVGKIQYYPGGYVLSCGSSHLVVAY